MTQLVKPLRGGQITIPAQFRDEMQFGPDTLLQLTLVGQELRLRPVKISTSAGGTAWLEKIYQHFSKVRLEAKKYPEAVVNRSIDKAVSTARSRHV